MAMWKFCKSLKKLCYCYSSCYSKKKYIDNEVYFTSIKEKDIQCCIKK